MLAIHGGPYGSWRNCKSSGSKRSSYALPLKSSSHSIRETETHGIGYAGIDIFAAVVDRARSHFEQQYPDSQFHVLLWDDRQQSKAERVHRRLAERNIRDHRVSDIIEVLDHHPERSRLSPHDGHPNSSTYPRLSQYVSNAILH